MEKREKGRDGIDRDRKAVFGRHQSRGQSPMGAATYTTWDPCA